MLRAAAAKSVRNARAALACAVGTLALASASAQAQVVPSTPPWQWAWLTDSQLVPTPHWDGAHPSGDSTRIYGNWGLAQGTQPTYFRPGGSFPAPGQHPDDVYIDPAIPGAAANARIAPGTHVRAGRNIGRLNLAASATLTLDNDARLGLAGPQPWNPSGASFINGEIRLNATNTGTGLELAGGTALLGSGVITLGDSTHNFIAGAFDAGAGGTVTFGPALTIRGGGRINEVFRQGFLNIINNGTIEATAAGGMDLVVAGHLNATIDNNGTLRARNGSTLRLRINSADATIDNAGALVEALDGSTVRVLPGVTLSGGTLSTAGSGRIRGNTSGGGGGTLRNLTNLGAVAIANDETLHLAGAIVNNGTISVDSTHGTAAHLVFRGGTSLSGTGQVLLSNSGTNYLFSDANGGSLLVASAATIRGAGQINPGFFNAPSLNIVNHGLIEASGSHGLHIGLANHVTPQAQLANGGTLRAAPGSTLRFHAFNVTGTVNNGGIIEAQDGGNVRVAPGVTVVGGFLLSHGAGAIRGNGPGGGSGVLQDLTNLGRIASDAGETIAIAGTLTNNGLVALSGGTSGAALEILGPTTLAGTGRVQLSNHFNNHLGGRENTGTHALTLAPGAAIEGAGAIGGFGFQFGPQPINIVNRGLIQALFAANPLNLRLGSAGLNNGDGGALRALAGATLHLAAGTIDNAGGTIEAIDGGAFSLAPGAALANNAAGTLAGGTYRAADGTIHLGGSPIASIAPGTTVAIAGPAGSVRAGANVPIENTLASNAGLLRIEGARTLAILNSLSNSGTLHARDAASVIAVGGTLTSTGILAGDGTIQAATLNLPGTLAPGNSPGALNLVGDVLLQPTSVLQFELSGLAGPNDHIDIAGGLTLDGTLNITALPGFGIGTYELIRFTGHFADNGLQFGQMPDGYAASLLVVPPVAGALPGSVQLVVVPEPTAALSLLGLCAAGALARRRRR